MRACKQILFLFLLFAPGLAVSQNSLRLQDCLRLARESSVVLQQADISVRSAEVRYLQSRYNFLPSVNAALNTNRGIGPTVDNFNLQITNSPTIAQAGIGASLLLFGGLTKYNTYKSQHFSLMATRFAAQDAENDLLMNVVWAYFAVVFDQENLKIAETRKGLVEKQLEKAEKQLQSGVLTASDVSQFKAQLATENVSLINAQNQVARGKLTLLQLLDQDPGKDWIIEIPELSNTNENTPIPDLGTILAEASDNFPALKAKALQIEAAGYALKASKGAYYPTLSMGYQLGSRFSSAAKEQIRVDTIFGFPVPVYSDKTQALGEQLDRNFNQALTLSLNVPIFNNYRFRQNVELSEINCESADLALQMEEKQLVSEIQQAWMDATASQTRLLATREQVAATGEAHEFASKKFEAGLMDFYTYLGILNNKTQAETQLLSSRYDFGLKLKILEYYRGKNLETLLD